MHLGLGPVFASECLTTARRWQYYAARVFFIGALLAALGIAVWALDQDYRGLSGLKRSAIAGEWIYFALTGTQLALLILVAPAVTAGAICIDKARGTLMHLLVTDLSNREIVLGKLLARLLPICGFVLAGLPVLALATWMGGVHPEAVFGSFVVCLSVAIFGGTMALVLSVWCAKTYEVLLVSYLLWTALLLADPLSAWIAPPWFPRGFIHDLDPFYLCFAPYLSPGSLTVHHYVNYLVGTLGVSAVLVLLATLRIRAVTIRQSGVVSGTNKGRRSGLGQRLWGWIPVIFLDRNPFFKPVRWIWRRLPAPSLDGNPVLWREWHRQRPSRWVRAVWAIYFLTALGFSLWCFIEGIAKTRTTRLGPDMAPFVNAFQIAIGLLLVSVTSVTSLQEERVRGSLDLLLTTTLPTVKIFWGKWWGSYRTVLWLTPLPLLAAAGDYAQKIPSEGLLHPLFYSHSRFLIVVPLIVLCYGAGFTSLGLALAVWIKRPGRALATSVTMFVFATVGWFVLCVALFTRDPHGAEVACGSCWFAGAMGTVVCTDVLGPRDFVLNALIMWCIAYTVGAALLAVLACSSFDRCMGRIPDHLRPVDPLGAAVERMRRRRKTMAGATPLVEPAAEELTMARS
jgi:ABC-type transport system involved in multi-copper enzyme maturation permease subunit